MDDTPASPEPCLTYVHHSEINQHPLDVQSQAQHRLHAGVKASRAKVVDAFLRSEKQHLVKRAAKLGMCGVSPVIRLEVGRRPCMCPGRCRDRLCPLCSRLRGQAVRRRVKALATKANALRFVTFTLPRDEASLGGRIDKLLHAFSALRRRAFWKDRCKGGLFVIETTRGRKGEHWHVHLHVLVDGEYMAQSALKAEWSEVVGSEAIVDIRAAYSREKAVNYVCKYVSKGSDVDAWDDVVICEYAEGVHRRRLMGTFGGWHKADVNEQREDDEPDELPRHGTTWAKLKAAIDAGTLDRRETVESLWQLGYLWRLLLAEEIDDPPEVTVVPGARVYHAMTVTMLDIEGVAERDQGQPTAIKVVQRDTQGGLWQSTGYV